MTTNSDSNDRPSSQTHDDKRLAPTTSSASRPAAVVVSLHTMQGLQTARLLHQHGVDVYGITGEKKHPFNHTAHCVEVLAVDLNVETLSDVLVGLGQRLAKKAVLVPCADWAVRDISADREKLDPFYLHRLPPHDVVEMLMDKTTFQAHAEAVGLPVPESRVITNRAEAEDAADSMVFPCVLKPGARSSEWSANTSEKAFQLADGAALLDVYDRVCDWVDALVVQQWIVGPEDNLFSVNGYFDNNGTCLASFVARKVRQWPVRTGQSSMGVESRNDAVLELFHKLFSGVDYKGLAYLEVKQDERTGDHFLVEPNIGRPTGRSAIAEAGGVELLNTMYCDIAGFPLPPPEARTQKYGDAKWIHLRRDLMSSATMVRSGELGLRAWRQSIKGPKFYAIYDRQDLRPFFGELFRVGGLGAQSLLTKLVRAIRRST